MTDRRLISRLLAGRDRLSRVEKEEILDTVLKDAAPARRTRWWFVAAPALAAAATVMLVLAAPWRSSTTGGGDFTARGTGQLSSAFTPSCTHGCGSGDKILFDLHGTQGYRYFAAFAQRADGTVIWYFPTEDGTTVDLVARATRGVLDQGIVIGGEHPPGTYRIFGVFSHEPLTRQQIRARFDEATISAGAGTEVVVQELAIR